MSAAVVELAPNGATMVIFGILTFAGVAWAGDCSAKAPQHCPRAAQEAVDEEDDEPKAWRLLRTGCKANDVPSCAILAMQLGQTEGSAGERKAAATKACDGAEALGCFDLGEALTGDYERVLKGYIDMDPRARPHFAKACALGPSRLVDFIADPGLLDAVACALSVGADTPWTDAKPRYLKGCDAGIGSACFELARKEADFSRATHRYGEGCEAKYFSEEACAPYGDALAAANWTADARVSYLRSCSRYNDAARHLRCVAAGDLTWLDGDRDEAMALYAAGCKGGDAEACGRLRATAPPARPAPKKATAPVQAWIETLMGPASMPDAVSPTLGTLKWIPPGTFTMGSPVGEAGRGADEREHRVTLLNGFHLMATEVTQRQFQAIMKANPAVEFEGSAMIGPDMPVQNVTVSEALAFANAVSKAEGLTACYAGKGDGLTPVPDCTGYRLPTEAEWERAARGGGATVFAGTSDAAELCAFGNVGDASAKRVLSASMPRFVTTACDDGVPYLSKGGQYRPNGYGLSDMTGNVEELIWGPREEYRGGGTVDRISSSSGGIFRGGSCLASAPEARVADRHWLPGDRNPFVGFRLARSRLGPLGQNSGL